MASLRSSHQRRRLAIRFGTLLCLTGGLFSSGVDASTVSLVYDFEPPQFTLGELSPMLAKAASPGSTFRADFGDAAVAGEFGIAALVLNQLFSGNALVDITDPPSALTLSFNQPVTRLRVNFAVEESGRLELISALGSVVADSGPAGGSYEGGELELVAPSGVLAVQLSAFTDNGRPNLWAIDNLRLEVVPEPSAALLLIGAAWLAAGIRRHYSSTAR
jgi:hypothetical protein